MTSPDQSADSPDESPEALPPLDPDIAEAVNALGAEAWWAIDIVPLLKPQESDPLARFAILLVMAHEVVVYTEFIKHPGADQAVPLVVHALRAAAHKAGVWPEKVLVRWDGFDLNLQDAIDDAGEVPDVHVYGVSRFADYPHPAGAAVDQTILDLRHHMDGVMIPDVPASSSPTWMAWGVSRECIEAFFRETAAVYRAVMARRFAKSDGDGSGNPDTGDLSQQRGGGGGGGRNESGALLVLEDPELLDSLAVLFGDDDRLGTLMLFTAREDWDAMVEAGATDPVSADVHFPVSCISFVPKEQLWGGMAEEVTAQQWDVADEAAYPTLWILNGAGGGMTTAYCTAITHQLAAIARAITAGAREPLHAESIFRYEDTETGLVVRTMLEE